MPRLKLAAEEVAWLTGQGYPLECRRRAAREVEAEDIAKRPLAIDAIDVVAALEATLAGRFVVQTLDGTVRAFGVDRATYAPGEHASDAITRLFAAAKS